MKIIYDLVFLIFSVIYLPCLILKGKAHKDFAQRFGFLPGYLKGEGSSSIWLHTVSVGEVLASKSFVKALKKTFPDKRLVISTTTKTGQDMAKQVFGEEVPTFYFPLDFSFVVSKVLNFIDPYMVIIFETEIWPNFIMALKKRNTPVFLVNGRISSKSFRGYRLIRPFLKPVLRKINLLCMQTEYDAERVELLGASPKDVRITGNMKYDIAYEGAPLIKDHEKFGDFLGISPQEYVIIGGSTHAGEEETLIRVYKDLLNLFANLRLLIAPRHVDRVEEIEGVCRKHGLNTLRTSEANVKKDVINRKPVLILDTMGNLSSLYSVATVVFIGGSLIKKGGHNIVEPARFSKPVVFGPYMDNFRDMAERFLNYGASVLVYDIRELKETFMELLNDEQKRDTMGKRAAKLVEENRGAVENVVGFIKDALSK